MKTSSPLIGILILNRDGLKWLPSIYDSLRAQRYRHFRTYLVDNASTDGSVEWTLQEHPEVKVIRMPHNLGYSMAYNLAMPYAFVDGCHWAIWANNDIKLEADCLQELSRIAVRDRQIGIVGPAFLSWENDEPNSYILGNHPSAISAIRFRSPEPISVDWVEGSFLMVSRRCVEAVGGLDPYYFMYSEEADFCRRARYQGWKVHLAPKALARHYAGGSSKGRHDIRNAMNRLEIRNYYSYHLVNPFQSFSRNVLETAHLFGVRVKEHVTKHAPGSIGFEARVCLFVLKNLQTIFLKWRRDRAGGKPPTTTPDQHDVRPEILGSRSHREGRNPLPIRTLRASR